MCTAKGTHNTKGKANNGIKNLHEHIDLMLKFLQIVTKAYV